MGVVATALAYLLGIASTRMLGSRLASFVALAEVVAALLFGWLLLGQLPDLLQALGGVLVLVGVVVVKLGRARRGGIRRADARGGAGASRGECIREARSERTLTLNLGLCIH